MAKKRILWVDDDTDDLEMFSDAVAALRLPLDIHYARNGQEAMAQLEEDAQQQKLPCLVILDMNMPQMSGRETLVALRSNPAYAGINAVVFTTSESPLDRMTCDKYGVQLYIKPRTYDELKETIRDFLAANGCAPEAA